MISCYLLILNILLKSSILALFIFLKSIYSFSLFNSFSLFLLGFSRINRLVAGARGVTTRLKQSTTIQCLHSYLGIWKCFALTKQKLEGLKLSSFPSCSLRAQNNDQKNFKKLVDTLVIARLTDSSNLSNSQQFWLVCLSHENFLLTELHQLNSWRVNENN